MVNTFGGKPRIYGPGNAATVAVRTQQMKPVGFTQDDFSSSAAQKADTEFNLSGTPGIAMDRQAAAAMASGTSKSDPVPVHPGCAGRLPDSSRTQ
jgi:hypothetical protein